MRSLYSIMALCILKLPFRKNQNYLIPLFYVATTQIVLHSNNSNYTRVEPV